jgi:hypothetical protein
LASQFDDLYLLVRCQSLTTNSGRIRKINAEGLAENWLGDATIGPLTGNPLLLSTLLMVHHLDGKLPNGRANLYKRYVDGMLGYWDERYKRLATDIQLTPDEKRKIIRGIALRLFLTDQETIDEHVLVEWLEKFLPTINIKVSATGALAILRERTGLLIGPGIYSFVHKTIAEFLVTETVLQGDQKDNLGKRIDRFHLFEQRNDDRWNTVLFLWAGMTSFLDLKSFLDECIKEGNWQLVFGLLYDQYDKFPLIERKRIFESINTVIDTYQQWGSSSFGFPEAHHGAILGAILEVPDFNLRGLTPYLSFTSLLFRAFENNEISDDYLYHSHENMKAILWFNRWLTSTEPSTWLSLIESRPTKIKLSSLKKHSAYIIYSYRLKYRSDLGKIHNFRETYLKLFPDYEGYLTWALITVLFNLVSLTDEKDYKDSICYRTSEMA